MSKKGRRKQGKAEEGCGSLNVMGSNESDTIRRCGFVRGSMSL